MQKILYITEYKTSTVLYLRSKTTAILERDAIFNICVIVLHCKTHRNTFQAPISEIWDNITVGMKVEVENTDCDEVCEAFPDSFWVATVLRICGYRALLRYEGFGHNAEKDFWVSLCSNDIHPVGWCATIGKPLIPPNST